MSKATEGMKATDIVIKLAEWSKKYPRSRIYPMSKMSMDEELIEIEDMAKKWLDEQSAASEPIGETYEELQAKGGGAIRIIALDKWEQRFEGYWNNEDFCFYEQGLADAVEQPKQSDSLQSPDELNEDSINELGFYCRNFTVGYLKCSVQCDKCYKYKPSQSINRLGEKEDLETCPNCNGACIVPGIAPFGPTINTSMQAVSGVCQVCFGQGKVRRKTKNEPSREEDH